MTISTSETATARTIDEMTLYGKRPFSDELDHRPLPDADTLRHGLSDIFDVTTGIFANTRLEEDAEGLLWGLVNVFHRKVERVQKALNRNEDDQRQSQREQDGSEIKSVELEDLITEGHTMLEQRDIFELMRDYAADLFETITGSVWRPVAGSKFNHKTATAAIIDSRVYIKAKQQKETQVQLPDGVLIAFGGGTNYQNHDAIWAALDKVLQRLTARSEKMVLAHGGAASGADLIADKWAAARKVPRVPFTPDWSTYGKKRAGFVRNDHLLDQNPAGVVIFPGSGVTENLADKARAQGIAVYRPVPKGQT